MKICYWTPNAGGGAGKYEYYLPREMKKLGVEVEVFRRPKGLKGNPLTLRLVYKCDGHIVHATTSSVSIYSYPKPKTFVVTNHGLRFTPRATFEERIKRILASKSLKRADKIIAVSEFTKKEAIHKVGVEEDKVVVIPLGVDRSKYKPLDREYCRRILGLNLEEKYILVVATSIPLKRLDITKDVLQRVREFRDDVKLIKCGHGKLKGEGIINMGIVPDDRMPILYNAADVLLHTSEYENWSMPPLEAMACGIPVVASNKGGIPEVVGDCGELVDLDAEDCVEQFAEKVLDCIDKGDRNEKGIERANKFSWEKVARETMKVYEELLRN